MKTINLQDLSQHLKTSFTRTEKAPLLRQEKFMLGTYKNFGQGYAWQELRRDILFFLEEQQRTYLHNLLFFAAYPDDFCKNEFDFARSLERELFFLDKKVAPHCWSLQGHELLVAGFHPNALSEERKFPFPLIAVHVSPRLDTGTIKKNDPHFLSRPYNRSLCKNNFLEMAA